MGKIAYPNILEVLVHDFHSSMYKSENHITNEHSLKTGAVAEKSFTQPPNNSESDGRTSGPTTPLLPATNTINEVSIDSSDAMADEATGITVNTSTRVSLKPSAQQN